MAARHRRSPQRTLVSMVLLLALIAAILPIGASAPQQVAAADQVDATPVVADPVVQESPVAPTPNPSPSALPTAIPAPTAPVTSDPFDAAAVATLIVHVRDAADNPLLFTCAALWIDAGGGTHGQRIDDSCDHADGDHNGDMQLEYPITGTYLLGLIAWPGGYWAPPDVQVTLIVGQTVEKTIVPPPGATIHLNAKNAASEALPGACYRLYLDAGGGVPGNEVSFSQICDSFDGNDGVTTILPSFPGDFVVVETVPATGYVLADSVPVGAHQSGQVIDVNVPHLLGGKVIVNLVDENDTALPGACFSAGNATSYYGSCDGDDGSNDGTTSIVGLPAGDYDLSNGTMPDFYNWFESQPFTIALGETKTFNLTGEPYGTIEIHKRTPENAVLTGACFEAQPLTFVRGLLFISCDNDNDGTISFKVPETDYSLVETQVPSGYVAAQPVQVHATSDQTATVEIVDPTPSTIVIHALDVNGALVLGLCWRLEIPDPLTYVDSACDDHDGQNDGLTNFGKLRTGDYKLTHRRTVTGYLKAPPTLVSLGVMETLDLNVLIPQPAPKMVTGPTILSVTQAAAIVYWETDQKSTGVVDYGLSENLGRIRPKIQPAADMQHTVELSPLEPGRLYYFQASSENVNGSVESMVFTFRTPSATATAKLSVTKMNADRTIVLPGACFDVFRDVGGGVIGNWVDGYCDKYDTAPMNGKVFFPALEPGAYILVETRAPVGYALAANRPFTITDGQTLRLSVRDSAGGALLTIKTRTGASKLLRSVCYTVYNYAGDVFGAIVAWGCDDYDGNNGYTPIGNLRAGTYWISQTYWPATWLPADGQKLVISSGQTTASATFTNFPENWADNIELQTIDGTGNLLPGACFILFSSPALAACDWFDGYNDGRTFFVDVDSSGYLIALEYHAPTGYKVGKRFTFFKDNAALKRVRSTQSPGGVRVTVKTLKGGTSTPLLDACYGLYKKPPSGSSWPAVAFWCDFEDGSLNGTTVLDGVPAGTYAVVQTYTPPGYARPADKIITVGSTGQTVTVRTYAGASAAGTRDRYPESIPGPITEPSATP